MKRWLLRVGGSPRRARPVAVVTAVVITGVILAAPAPADATWSVVAVDPENGQVGAAIASCVPGDVLGEPTEPLVPVALAPGIGAGVSQGQLDVTAPDRIVTLLDTDAEPAAVITELTDPANDELASVRQHAVATLADAAGQGDPLVAAHTGAELTAAALDRQGDGVSVQGNLLVSDAVVDDTLAAYQSARSDGVDLPSALVESLLAGSRAGGDMRCEDQTALFAQVVVADPDDDGAEPAVIVTVLVTEGDGQNPVEELAAAWSDGRRGLIDLDEPIGGTGPWFRVAVFVAAAVMVGAAVFAFRRGMGSVSARKTSSS